MERSEHSNTMTEQLIRSYVLETLGSEVFLKLRHAGKPTQTNKYDLSMYQKLFRPPAGF